MIDRHCFPRYCNIIPLVFDDTITYYEQLCKLRCKLNEIVEYIRTLTEFPVIEYVGIWDNGIAYPKNSMVSYDNKIYIALKDVPIGTDIGNTEYWSEIGEFTFAIEEITDRLETLQGAINALTTKVNSLNNRTKRKMTSDTKCLLIGNSFAYGSGGSGHSGWPFQLENMINCNATIIAQRGGDFCARATTSDPQPSYPNMTYREAITELVSGLSTADRLSYEWIIFGGGYNDSSTYYSYDDIVTEIKTTIGYCRQQFPNAEIAVIPLAACTHLTKAGLSWAKYYLKYMTAWSNAAIECGCYTTTDSMNWFFRKYEYRGAGDSNIHLNDAGYIKCAEYILAIINGWDGEFHINWSDDVTMGSTVVDTDFVTCVQNGDTVMLKGHVTLNGDGVITGDTMVGAEICTVPGPVSPSENAVFFSGYLYKTGAYQLIPLSLNSAGKLTIRNDEGQYTYPLDEDMQIYFDICYNPCI